MISEVKHKVSEGLVMRLISDPAYILWGKHMSLADSNCKGDVPEPCRINGLLIMAPIVILAWSRNHFTR